MSVLALQWKGESFLFWAVSGQTFSRWWLGPDSEFHQTTLATCCEMWNGTLAKSFVEILLEGAAAVIQPLLNFYWLQCWWKFTVIRVIVCLRLLVWLRFHDTSERLRFRLSQWVYLICSSVPKLHHSSDAGERQLLSLAQGAPSQKCNSASQRLNLYHKHWDWLVQSRGSS